MGVVSELWLPIPQAVFLLSTGDLRQARGFPDDDPNFLVFLIARALGSNPYFVPLDPIYSNEQLADAWQEIRQKLAADALDTEPYGLGLKTLRQILADGLAKAKGSRSLDGSFELIDPVEFTQVDLAIVHAIHAVTKKIVWYNVRVSGSELLNLRQSGGGANLDAPRAAEGEADRLKRRGGWQQAKWLRARDAAMEWLADNGCPDPGDGNQAQLERYIASWLEERGKETGVATIRRHVADWIKERRAELG